MLTVIPCGADIYVHMIYIDCMQFNDLYPAYAITARYVIS